MLSFQVQAMNLSRRTVLRGMGTAVSLPLLEAMTPRAALASGAPDKPLRMAFFFFPNGAIMQQWTPKETGTSYELPATLKPLESLRQEILVLSGLAHDKAKPNGDGPGDHARSAAAFLTGAQPKKTAGKDIHVGISVDQLAAAKIGERTPLASLELGCEQGAQAGNCDSGYSCAYSSAISWRTASSPMTKEVVPRAVFERLFGDPDQAAAARERARRAAAERSILDLAREDAARLSKKLGGTDKQKLDEYLESVRAVEKRIQAVEAGAAQRKAPDVKLPEGTPRDHREHVKLMLDLLVLAFQTDSTRIATFMIQNEGSNRSYPFLGVNDGHHTLSHHQNNQDKMAKIQKIDQFNVEQYAYLVGQLASIREGDGTILDRSMILCGCAIADGNRHNHNELPVVLAGRAGGAITPGRHVRYPKDTPMANLFLSMLERLGIREERFGDSTARLDQLKI
jgi:hypothetical protein